MARLLHMRSQLDSYGLCCTSVRVCDGGGRATAAALVCQAPICHARLSHGSQHAPPSQWPAAVPAAASEQSLGHFRCSSTAAQLCPCWHWLLHAAHSLAVSGAQHGKQQAYHLRSNSASLRCCWLHSLCCMATVMFLVQQAGRQPVCIVQGGAAISHAAHVALQAVLSIACC